MTSRPELTPQQALAISQRDVSLALSAGAGCGKTTVLTARFLSYLEPGTDAASLSELVAITFTDRAAREMRDRIRKACRERLQNCVPEETEHWLAVLYGLDSARIATIHSFCTTLLRGHAVEAGLDPGFIVTDAAQTSALIERSARETLHRLLERQDDDAVTLVLHFGLERSRNILAELISQRFRWLNADVKEINAEDLAAAWIKHWRERCVPDLVAEFRVLAVCERTRDWLREHQPIKQSVMRERCRAVLHWLSLADWSDPKTALEELRQAARVQGGGGKSVWSDEEEHDEVKELFEALRGKIEKYQERMAYQADHLPLAAELTVTASRLAAMAIADYETLKSASGRLDFDDLLLKARDLLHKHPAVAQKLAAGIRLLMVDEFQDTDLVQADLIRLLCGPALTTGKLFLVGDAQQSIYRFRRAEPQIFADFQSILRLLPLSVNFRSQPEILDFVNHFFSVPLGKDFQQLTPCGEQLSPRPTIEFLWATSDVKPAAPGAGNDSAKVEQLRRREAEWIALRIGELLADERPLVRDETPPGLRRVKARDIVILFRTLSDAPAYEAALEQQGLDYYLVGGKTFYVQQEVFDLLNLGRYLIEPADEISLVGCLRSPMFNLSDDAIHALGSPGETLTNALHQTPPHWLPEPDRQRIRFAAETLAELRRLKDELVPSELFQTVIEQTGYDAALLHEHLGSRKLANLKKLLVQAVEFDDGELFSLNDYVGQLERSIQQQTDEEFAATLEESGDVVRLMTIHQSKGLEFPVVFIADMNRRGQPRGSGTLLHEDWGALLKPPEEFGESREHLGLRIHALSEEPKEAAEMIRLLYVATTRAADRLILSAGMTPDLKLESSWMKLLAEGFDLATGLPKYDPLLGTMAGAKTGRKQIPDVQVHPHPPRQIGTKPANTRLVSLAQLRASVETADAGEFPESVRTYPAATDWLGTISVSTLERLAGERGSIPAVRPFDDEEEWSTGPADVIGTVVHAVLQRWEPAHAENWRDLLEACLITVAPADREAVSEAAERLIERFFESPLRGDLATAREEFREVDFALQWPVDAAAPRAILTGQIDLLQRVDSGWRLLDYKTGNFPVDAPNDELLAPYALQLGIYALAAERMLGEPLASIGLVVLRPEVRWLPFSWTERDRRQLISRIDDSLKRMIQADSAGVAVGLPR